MMTRFYYLKFISGILFFL